MLLLQLEAERLIGTVVEGKLLGLLRESIDLPPHELAAALRRVFSATVTGDVQGYGV